MKKILKNNWQHRTIESLEDQNFGDIKDAPTFMVKRCLELCKIPLGQFTIEDLRLMIGQEFSLSYLIPIALEHLKVNLFSEGDYYPGDLLNSVLSVNSKFWKENIHLWNELNGIIKGRHHDLSNEKISTDKFDKANQ